jgi:hypothetical protein
VGQADDIGQAWGVRDVSPRRLTVGMRSARPVVIASGPISVPESVLTVKPSDAGVLFACAETHRTIVVFLVDARVAMIEQRASEVRMVATIDCGC